MVTSLSARRPTEVLLLGSLEGRVRMDRKGNGDIEINHLMGKNCILRIE